MIYGGMLLHVPLKGESQQIALPRDATLRDANLIAAGVLGAEPPLVEHRIDEDVVAFTMIQDGVYDYNQSVTFAIESLLGIIVAFEGPVVLCMLPPEILSR